MTRPPIKVDIAFDSTYSTAAASRTWTDVTEYVLTSSGISAVTGRRDERSQADANTCSLSLNNSDGRFTPGLASSPYYPNVKIGRPIRVCVNLCTHGDNGTFEGDITGWSGVSASLAQSGQFHAGAWGLSITSTTASGNASAVTPSGTSGIPVVAGVTYRVSSWFKRGPTARQCDLLAVWYDSVGTQISSSGSAQITDSATWQQINLTATAPTGAVYVRIQARILAPSNGEVHYIDDVRLDVDRFTGYVDEWPLEWPGVVSTFATSTITASSRMARLGLSDPLKSIVEQEILADSPAAYYTMGEPEGSTRANDSSGGLHGPLLVRTNPAYPSRVQSNPVFGTATGPGTDGLTAVQFIGNELAETQSKPLWGTGVLTPATIELFFSVDSGGVSSTNDLVSVGGTSIYVAPVDEKVHVVSTDFPSIVSTTSANDGRTRHLAVRQDGGNVRLYLDGVLEGSSAGTMGSSGGQIKVAGHTIDGTTVIAHLALYTTAPSAARLAEHAEAGLDGFLNETADTRLARYASYADIPAAEYSFSTNANTQLTHIDTTGQGVIALMQQVAETDGGVLYDAPDGTLTYKARSARYNTTATPTLDVSAGEVEAGYVPKYDRSALTNRMTASLSDGTYSETAENTASITEYGVHGTGDLTLHATDDDHAHAAAWWRVNTYSEPSARAPQLGVELAKMTPARQARILSIQVGDRIAVSNLPSQSDTSTKEFFVEGWTETISDSQLRIEFNVSPAAGFNVWEIEHATYGQYDAYPLAF